MCTIRIVNKWDIIINQIEVNNVNVFNQMIDIRDGRMIYPTLSR